MHTLSQIQQQQHHAHHSKKQQIRALPNLNFNLERLLRKVDIHTVEQLCQAGEVRIIVALVQQGVPVNAMTLFKLHAAIRRQLVYTLPDSLKMQLLQEADTALYAAGLRPRFARAGTATRG